MTGSQILQNAERRVHPSTGSGRTEQGLKSSIIAVHAEPVEACGCFFQQSVPDLKPDGGFTLLEVVVAMAIVGLGVVTLLGLFSQGLRLGARSSVNSEALTYGRQVLDEFFARRDISDGREEGAFGNRNRWRLEVQPAREQSRLTLGSAWELKEVTLQMRYGEGAGERRIEMKTFRLVKKKNP